MKQYLLKSIFHPYLICLYIIFNAINVIVEFEFKEFLGLTFVFFLFVFLVSSISCKYTNVSKYKFSYLLTYVIYIFFFIYEVTSFLSEITFTSLRLRYIIIILSLLLLFFSSVLFKSKREFLKINLYFNLLFFFFCGFEMYKFVEQKHNQSEPKLVNINKTKPKPNIYFLMIDGYANNKSLKKYWGYDNRPFTDSLQKLGFKYIEDSKSDYLFTIQTVASLLNFEKINGLDKENSTELIKKIKHNKLTQLLIERGYHVENLSIFNIHGTENNYNLWFGDSQKNILTYLFRKSLVGRYLEILNKSHESKLKREIKIDEELMKIVRKQNKTPKFVFYHSLQVHHPFRDGEEKKGEDLIQNIQNNKNTFQSLGSVAENKKWMREYIQQINACNKKTIFLVTEILKYDPHCKIFLFSDHGFRLLTGVSSLEARKESFMNFSAVYMHNSEYKGFELLHKPTEIAQHVYNLVTQ